MISALHRVSSISFYVLGIVLLLSYLLLRNDVSAPYPGFFLSILDLPAALSGMAYGGSSLYLSVKHPEKGSPILGTIIFLPLLILFGYFVVLNFWELIAISK